MLVDSVRFEGNLRLQDVNFWCTKIPRQDNSYMRLGQFLFVIKNKTLACEGLRTQYVFVNPANTDPVV